MPSGPFAPSDLGQHLKVAMVAPLAESVPPKLYGGTERVVFALTEELVARGHQVTLFASGDSQTHAELIACCPRSLRLAQENRNLDEATVRQMRTVYDRASDFDIIHNHIDWWAFRAARNSSTPTVTTTHGRLDPPEIRAGFASFPEQRLISISNDQRRPLPFANWLGTVYNGIELSHFHFQPVPGTYLAFLGRICPEKRPDLAIHVARELDMPLIMAAKIDPIDRAYYETRIAPLIRDSAKVEYIGEVDESRKDQLLGGAYAYLFPIDWPEPFGLTMAEAMATGTPVVALSNGSVPEVVLDGATGFICDNVREMIEAVPRVASIDRAACRAHVQQRFSAAAMAEGYERAYLATLAGSAHVLGPEGPPSIYAPRPTGAQVAPRAPSSHTAA